LCLAAYWFQKHKVPQVYSRAELPIHAKSGREWGPECARSFTTFGMTALRGPEVIP